MTLFSEREGLTARGEITDSAPDWFRNGFYNQAIQPFLYLDRTSNPFASPTDSIGSPIGVKLLIEKISFITKISPPSNYRMDAVSFSALQAQLSVLPWFHFYNAIELISEMLRNEDNENRDYLSRYLARFCQVANKLFDEGAVGWQLTEFGKLQRKLPAEVFNLESSAVSASSGSPTAAHISKARGFINQHPCDAANAIKESVSAVESLACTLVPGAKTLGDAIPRLRNNTSYPPLLLTVIEKLYAFASDEPAVRHGGAKEERVIRNDAEFIFVTSLATIKYLQEAGN